MGGYLGVKAAAANATGTYSRGQWEKGLKRERGEKKHKEQTKGDHWTGFCKRSSDTQCKNMMFSAVTTRVGVPVTPGDAALTVPHLPLFLCLYIRTHKPFRADVR